MKSPNKHIAYLVLGLAILSVFFIILFSSLFTALYNVNYYDSEYRKYNVYEKFPRDAALNQTRSLMGYFQSRNNLDPQFFNEAERSHLADVKQIIGNVNFLYYFSVLLFWILLALMYLFERKYFLMFFSRLLQFSGIFAAGMILLLGLVYLIAGFDFLFIRFHELFFTGNYAFDPAVSNMKSLFPDAFFSDMGVMIILNTLLKSALLTGAGFFLKRKFK